MQNILTTASKELLVEALTELMLTRREEFGALIGEALEHAGLVAAMHEGRTSDFVSEEEVLILQ